jgi:hypothetical protein
MPTSVIIHISSSLLPFNCLATCVIVSRGSRISRMFLADGYLTGATSCFCPPPTPGHDVRSIKNAKAGTTGGAHTACAELTGKLHRYCQGCGKIGLKKGEFKSCVICKMTAVGATVSAVHGSSTRRNVFRLQQRILKVQ